VSRARVGLGLRFELQDELAQHLDDCAREGRPPGLDFVELAPENFMRRGGPVPATLSRIAEHLPLVAHGLSLAPGGLGPMDDGFVAALRGFLRERSITLFSEHLCASGEASVGPAGAARRFAAHELLPLPHTRAEATRVAARARELEARLEQPLALENVTTYFTLGAPELDEATFVCEVLEGADVGLLLDLNNALVNAKNSLCERPGAREGASDAALARARAFVDALPLERTRAIHLAGHEWSGDEELFLDTHGAEVSAGSLALLAHVLPRVGDVPLVIERDHHVPKLDVLLDEVARVRAIADAALAGLAPGAPPSAASRGTMARARPTRGPRP
jgi:uncharacterized protein (UPF0276 family)